MTVEPTTVRRRWATAGLLGALLALGWAAVAVAFLLSGSAPTTIGDALALGIVVVGVVLLAAVSAVGARAAWKHAYYDEPELPRRLMTAGLCTVVVAGWPAVGALTQGLDGVLDPVGAGALALTALGGATLVVMHRARNGGMS